MAMSKYSLIVVATVSVLVISISWPLVYFDAYVAKPTVREKPGTVTKEVVVRDIVYWVHKNFSVPLNQGPDNMTNVTLVSHITENRIFKALLWCERWKGPMSLSFFLRHNESTSALEPLLNHSCIRSHAFVHVVQLADPKPPLGEEADWDDLVIHYPYNVMRNAALDGAKGEWVFLTDIDFDMYPATLQREKRFTQNFYAQINRAGSIQHAVFVVPAVETVAVAVDHPTSYKTLLQAMRLHNVCAFYGHHCSSCHLPTAVERIAEAPDEPYIVRYTEGYEPYVVANKSLLPRYDDAFVGRGWSKMSFFFEVWTMKLDLVVIGGPFLVHTGRGNAPLENLSLKRRLELRRNNEALWNNFKRSTQKKYNVASNDSPELVFQAGEIDLRGIAASNFSHPTACVSRIRPEDVDSASSQRLWDAIASACVHINCSEIEKGDRVSPDNTALKADWAFDRYYHHELAAGKDHRVACDFNGLGKIVDCEVGCYGCLASESVPPEGLVGVATWACEATQACNTFKALGQNRDPHAFASLVFTFMSLTGRCTLTQHCEAEGKMRRVPCAQLPQWKGG